jgi:nucleoside-diphosphate-sugar epimerase
VIHLASPFVLDSKDYEKDLFVPAVNGTVSILKAVKEYNQSVKRVVITSSFAAVLDFPTGRRPGYVYTEEDWNPMTTEEAKKTGPAAAYLVSKTLAERAAYDFVNTEKPNFSITTLNPPMVYGPLLQDVESMSKLNTSSFDVYRLFNGSLKEVPETTFWACIDVRDGRSRLVAEIVFRPY